MSTASEHRIALLSRSLDCIHCGLCLRTCPTYRLTGSEAASPRGRIHLMRAVVEERLPADADYAREMEFCLVCRHCESVCPAGVRFGEMMELAREELPRGPLERLARRVGLRWILPRRAALRALFGALRLVQRSGVVRLFGRLAGKRAALLQSLPEVPPREERRLLPEHAAVRGATRARAFVLEGCVQAELFGHVNRATTRSLAELGVECRPLRATCCGSLHAHNGDRAGARELARRLIEAAEAPFEGALEPPLIAVNSAGCGSHMKELAHLFEEGDPWRARATAFSARVRDYAELAAPLVAAALHQGRRFELPPGRFAGPITWDDPCHLCHGQGIRREPRAILDAITGLERVELAESESCCGSAGLYSLLRPEASRRVLAERLAALDQSGARTLVTANPGCQMQWSAGIRASGRGVAVVHLAELLAAAASDPGPR